MRTIKNIISALLLLSPSLAFAQQTTSDSLLHALKTAKHDTSRLSLYVQLSEESETKDILKYAQPAILLANKILSQTSTYSEKKRERFLSQKALALNNVGYVYIEEGKISKALDYYNKSLKIQEDINDKNGLSQTLNNLGFLQERLGNVSLALDYYKRNLKIKEELGDKAGTAIPLNNIAALFKRQGDVPKALEYFSKALKISEEAGDKGNLSVSLNNMADVCYTLKDIPKALDYMKKSLKIREEIGDKTGIAHAYNNIGTIYGQLGKMTDALNYFKKSLIIQEETGDKMGISGSLNNVATLYLKLGELNSALDNYTKSLKIKRELGDKQGLASLFNSIGLTYIQQKKYSLAKSYCDSSLTLSKELGFPDNIKNASFSLKIIYQKQNDFKKALEMHELYIAMNDSISNENNRKASYKSQLKYEFEKKALADSIKASDEKKLASASLAESVAKLKQQKTQRFALIGGLALMLGFSGVVYNRFKNSQKQKRIIEEQKLIVDESQKKIISSINYAKKIQYSILPSNEEIAAFFPQHFVMFKPKDIVSGDFYWFHHENDLSFFAVADCTGHGVPGAFMTMIAHSILIEVVVEQKITSPDKILSHLHQLVFKNLQQQKGDEYSQDGMDISLGVIDHKNNLLHFSAARNNAFLIDDNEIKILKATSKSIGGLSLLGEIEPERDFKSETVEIKKGALLIFSTDGIFDQLNEQDEKFGSNRFKEMILNLNSGNADENLQITETTFNNWKGKAEQLDDVLLVGIKL